MEDFNSISPILQVDNLFSIRDYVVEGVKSQLNKANDNKEIFKVLSNLHVSQLKSMADIKQRLAEQREQMRKIKEAKEQAKLAEQQSEPALEEVVEIVEQNEPNNSEWKLDDSFFAELRKEADELQNNEQTTKEETQENFDNLEENFGGISLNMLNEDNKEFAQQSIATTNNENSYQVDGYINKQDYNEGKKYSASKLDAEQEFDPRNAEAEQYVDGGMPAVGVEEVNSNEPKYVVKEKHKSTSSVEGKGVAWMAYILFFLPLLFAGRKSFVRFHANEGLKINFFDIIAVALVIVGKFITVTDATITLALQIGMFLGIVLELILIECRIVLMLTSLFGKRKQVPFLRKIKIIKE